MRTGTIAERFAAVLTETCTIQRRPETIDGATLDSKLGEFANIATGVPCLIGQVSVSDDLRAQLPAEVITWRVLMKPDVDLKQHDLLIDADSAEQWAVIGVPQLCDFRGEDHHLEAIVERKDAV